MDRQFGVTDQVALVTGGSRALGCRMVNTSAERASPASGGATGLIVRRDGGRQ